MYLYAISSDSRYIKFGVGGRPVKRLIELQVGSPHDLKLLGEIFAYDSEPAFELERIVHRALRTYHVRGEWFQMVPKTIALVSLMKSLRYPEFRNVALGWCANDIANDAPSLAVIQTGIRQPSVYEPLVKRINDRLKRTQRIDISKR